MKKPERKRVVMKMKPIGSRPNRPGVVQFNFELNEKLAARLKTFCRTRGIKLVWFINEAISEKLDRVTESDQ